MGTKKIFGLLPFTALSLMTVYLIMIISYLFFMSGTPMASGGHTSHFRRKTESSFSVQRIDKTVLTQNKQGNTPRNSFILFHVKVPILSLKVAVNSQFTGFSPDLHHVYLSNRIIRI